MTKAEVIAQIMPDTKIEKLDVVAVVETLLAVVISRVAAGNEVSIKDFGTFYPHLRNKTIGRDIARNTLLIVPAHYIPKLRTYKNFTGEVTLAHMAASSI